MAAAIWRVSNHQGHPSKYSHSRSHSSPAAVSGSSGTPEGALYYSDRDREFSSQTDIPPGFPASPTSPSQIPSLNPAGTSVVAASQSLVLLQPSHPISAPRRPKTASGASPLRLSTTNISRDISGPYTSYSPTTNNTTSTSYATLSLLDLVGTGSGRRKLKEFPGYIPLSRYFIPPSASATPVAGNTPTTPTIPNFGTTESNLEVLDSKSTDTLENSTSSVEDNKENNNNNEKDDKDTLASESGPVAQPSDGTTNMEQHPPVAIIGDPEPLMTQDLLNFYKNRLHELEKSTQQELLERISVLRGFLLEHHDATNRLERQLHELQDENTSLSSELGDINTNPTHPTPEKLDQISKANETHAYDPIPSPDPSVTGSSHSKEPADVVYERIQTHYEDLIQQLLQKFNEQSAARESERTLANQNIDQLNDRCRRLETAVSDSLNDTIQERTKRKGLEEKLKETEEELNVSVFEMQSQIEIFERHINESRLSPVELQTVAEEQDDSDNEDFDGNNDVIPPEMYDEIVPDFASYDINARRKSQASPINRKTPSPTKSRRTPSPTLSSNLKNSVAQTEEVESDDVEDLRRKLSNMIAERQAEEALIKTKKAEFEDAYEKFAGIVEQARARENEYNHMKAECEELRIQIEELLETHDMDQDELLTRQNEIDVMFKQLEDSLKQGVVDKQEITRANKEVEELRKQLEEGIDTISVVHDDSELKNLRLQLEEAKRERDVGEETVLKANEEIAMLKERVEKLGSQHSEQVKEIEKSSIEIQGLKIQLEALTKQRSGDLETISKANAEIEGLRTQLDRETLESTQSTNEELNALREKLSESEAAKTALEKEKSRKEGDIKLLREQMQGLLRGQSSKEAEISRTREDLESLRNRYDELISDRKKDEEWRHENFMELEAVRQRLSDVMRIKEQEQSLHQRDADAWKRTDEEQQAKLKEVSGRLAEMVIEVSGRNDIMEELNETVERLRLADEASSIKMEEAKANIEALEREVQEEKRKVAVEITRANEKIIEVEERKKSAEAEVEGMKSTVQDLEERIRGYETAIGANQDSGQRIQELEQMVAKANAQLESIVLETDMEVEAMEREIEDLKAHSVEIADEANMRIETLDIELEACKETIASLKQDAEGQVKELQEKLVETNVHAEKQVSAAENELKKLEIQMKVEDAKASATIAAASERLAVLEKQIKTYEALYVLPIYCPR
ncbi:hypothetical protein ABW20_dc0108905 [Dactylellina cionopaga]|nr:hypothetical protein ABW20_dc0108905 [Dactylellina cionopaga]